MTMESSMRRDTLLVSSLVYVHHYWYVFTSGITKMTWWYIWFIKWYDIYMIYTCMHVFVFAHISVYIVYIHWFWSTYQSVALLQVPTGSSWFFPPGECCWQMKIRAPLWWNGLVPSVALCRHCSPSRRWRAGILGRRWRAGCLKELFHGGYPLVNVYIANWKIIIFNGKFNYKWPFSIAMLVYRRVNMLGITMCGSSQL